MNQIILTYWFLGWGRNKHRPLRGLNPRFSRPNQKRKPPSLSLRYRNVRFIASASSNAATRKMENALFKP